MSTLSIFKNIGSSAESLGLGLIPFCPEAGIPIAIVGGVGTFVMGFFGASSGDDAAVAAINVATTDIKNTINAIDARIQAAMNQDFNNLYWARVQTIQSGITEILNSFNQKQTDGTLTWNSVSTSTGNPYYLDIRTGFVTGPNAILGALDSPLMEAANFALDQDDGTHQTVDLVMNALIVYITAAKLFATLEFWYANKTYKAGSPIPKALDAYRAADGLSFLSENFASFLPMITTMVSKINADQTARLAKVAAIPTPTPEPLPILTAAASRYTAYDGGSTKDISSVSTNEVIFAMNTVYNILVESQTSYMTTVMGQTDFQGASTFPTS